MPLATSDAPPPSSAYPDGLASRSAGKSPIVPASLSIGFLLAVLYWPLDAAVMAFVLGEGSWLDSLVHPTLDGIWMRSFTSVVFIVAGGVAGALMDRHQRIARREAGIGEILENSLNEIYVFDAETLMFSQVNRGARRNLGYSMSELSSMTPLDIKPDHTLESFAELIRPLQSGAEAKITFDTVHLRKDGSTYPVEVHLQLTTIGDREAFVAIILDTTERIEAAENRRRLEGQVQHAQKLESLGVLAGGVAHDFNNLLTGVLGYADLALSDLAPESPARDSVEQITKAARQAADLARQMLAYSGKGKFVVRQHDLSALIREMEHLLSSIISKKAAFSFALEDGLPAIEADATQIRQVILNLISNASEAMGDESGVISVTTGTMMCDREYLRETYLDEDLAEGLYVFLEVGDNGCGMDSETKDKVFEPFFTTKFMGRGLGLAAVLGIVRSHRGALKVYSELGRGTTFKVLFPASSNPADVQSSEELPAVNWQGGGTVLVVDDEEIVRSYCRRLLQREGFKVLLAADGREGLEQFRNHVDEIVVVILDMTMPRMGGEETFREMRRIKNDVRVVLTSGYNEQAAIEQFSGKGLAGFIQKPYRRAELIAKLQEAIERE